MWYLLIRIAGQIFQHHKEQGHCVISHWKMGTLTDGRRTDSKDTAFLRNLTATCSPPNTLVRRTGPQEDIGFQLFLPCTLPHLTDEQVLSGTVSSFLRPCPQRPCLRWALRPSPESHLGSPSLWSGGDETRPCALRVKWDSHILHVLKVIV